jgi:hypothetical protein
MELTTCMLADGARQGIDGKFYIFGGQWDQVFVPSVPTTQKVAFAVVIRVNYAEALENHRFDIALYNSDGIDLETRISGQFRPGHPPLTEMGSPVSVPLAIEPPPVVINQYGRLIWKVSIDGREVGELPMVVRPPLNTPLPMSPREQPNSD